MWRATPGKGVKTILLFIGINLPVYGGEEDLYNFQWLDPDKKVYVLQNKVYEKDSRFYTNFGVIKGLSDSFTDSYGGQFVFGYNFHEEWGIETYYNKYSNSESTDFKNVRAVSGTEPFVRHIEQSYGLLVTWSPFYGKINTFNKIIYFDWYFGAGISRINAKSNLTSVTNETSGLSYGKENYNGAATKTGLKIHLTRSLNLGVEIFNTNYMAPGPRNPNSKSLRTNTDFILNFGVLFP